MITLTVEIDEHESEGDDMIQLLFEHVVGSRFIISSIDVLTMALGHTKSRSQNEDDTVL